VDFVALDVETANADYSSICQIGIVGFEKGLVAWTWGTLVNPQAHFDGRNIAIHGITEEHVADAPTFSAIFGEIRSRTAGRVVASHMPFDRLAIAQACERHSLEELELEWIDTARVARRQWAQFRSKGYGLANVAQVLGVEFRHHDALEDARACGEILVKAITEAQTTLCDWGSRAARPYESVRCEGNPEGHLAGEVIVFTGALSMSRAEAARRAAEAGCDVGVSVTASTTILVVGDQDLRVLNGHETSSKQRKAAELRDKGQMITILGETDFKKLTRFRHWAAKRLEGSGA
jgi:DNA polymerase III subunit epsilon